MTCIVDSREPWFVIDEFKAYCSDVQVRKLDVGDFIVGRLIFERKTIDDLVLSLLDGRLDRQLLNLVTYAEDNDMVPVLVIEGRPESLRPQFRDRAYGIVAACFIRYGVQVIWTTGWIDTVELVVKAGFKSLKEMGKPRRPIQLKVGNKVNLIAALLKVPISVAEEILKRGGLMYLVEASDEELLSIKGIGPKTLERIRWVLTGD